jgi:hypothetical protein
VVVMAAAAAAAAAAASAAAAAAAAAAELELAPVPAVVVCNGGQGALQVRRLSRGLPVWRSESGCGMLAGMARRLAQNSGRDPLPPAARA